MATLKAAISFGSKTFMGYRTGKFTRTSPGFMKSRRWPLFACKMAKSTAKWARIFRKTMTYGSLNGQELVASTN